jgi:hypothetical protein
MKIPAVKNGMEKRTARLSRQDLLVSPGLSRSDGLVPPPSRRPQSGSFECSKSEPKFIPFLIGFKSANVHPYFGVPRT